MKTFLAFTSESYAYDKTETKAKQRLLNECFIFLSVAKFHKKINQTLKTSVFI